METQQIRPLAVQAGAFVDYHGDAADQPPMHDTNGRRSGLPAGRPPAPSLLATAKLTTLVSPFGSSAIVADSPARWVC